MYWLYASINKQQFLLYVTLIVTGAQRNRYEFEDYAWITDIKSAIMNIRCSLPTTTP